MKKKILLLLLLASLHAYTYAEDGYRLWLRYDKIGNPDELKKAIQSITQLGFPTGSDILSAALDELKKG